MSTDYDVVIVGAGSAGAVLATRLTEDPERSVLLLEAGPDYPDSELLPDELKYGYGTGHMLVVSSAHNWDFAGRGTAAGPELYVPSGRVTGGTSAINGQIFLRGVPEDYDCWADKGNDEWWFRDLLPYFRMIESDRDFDGDIHGRDGPIPVHRFTVDSWLPVSKAFYAACRALGFPDCPDANAPYMSGVGACPFNNPDRIRMSTALGYLPQARQRPNFTLSPDTLAHRIVFDGKRAAGVEVEHDGKVSVVEGREIILCAGAIGSPALLLRSGVGPSTELGALGVPVVHELTGVGQNLQEHPIVGAVWRTRPEFSLDEDSPHGQCFLRFTAPTSQIRNDMFVRELQWGDELTLWTGTYSPVSRGRLQLPSVDPHAKPFIDYRFLEDEFDRRRLRDALRLCIALGEQGSFREIIAERLAPTDAELASEEALDDWLQRSVNTGRHVTSTCKMGPPSDAAAVVDQYGSVHGLEGIRVVDASIMPTIVRANTNATTIMIAERIADLLVGSNDGVAGARGSTQLSVP